MVAAFLQGLLQNRRCTDSLIQCICRSVYQLLCIIKRILQIWIIHIKRIIKCCPVFYQKIQTFCQLCHIPGSIRPILQKFLHLRSQLTAGCRKLFQSCFFLHQRLNQFWRIHGNTCPYPRRLMRRNPKSRSERCVGGCCSLRKIIFQLYLLFLCFRHLIVLSNLLQTACQLSQLCYVYLLTCLQLGIQRNQLLHQSIQCRNISRQILCSALNPLQSMVQLL